MLKSLLAHPLTRGLDIDDPHTTALRRKIIQKKNFLRKIYEEWYKTICEALPKGNKPILELGSGAGFLGDFIPNLITSDVFDCPDIMVVLDGCQLPFGDESLSAIVMTDVFHHMQHSKRFFAEASRCVKKGGTIIMIEPWVTPWSRLVYSKLHHEPFQPKATDWELPQSGPLSGANSALPWIIFERDRTKFEKKYPEWQIQEIKTCMPFRYLVSGGVSLKSFMPGWTFGLWRYLENYLQPWMKAWAMFAKIKLVKINTPARMK
ncbi:MAG: class I SAM-dependent methyltransferase [Candidatus Aminicenantes bacterium]|nr:MAG: class I SAM-dependent methyltransferase [Candidatus Aminicenantes bacterium]